MAMKIGMVHLNLAVESGDPRMFYSIARRLKNLGHNVTIYTARFDRACFPELHAGLEVIAAPAVHSPLAHGAISGFTDAVSARLARSRFQEEAVRRVRGALPGDLDVLICQNDYSYELGIPYKRQRPRARVVWIMNNLPFYWERKRNILLTFGSMAAAFLERIRVRRALSGIDLIVVHDEERRKAAEALGKPALLLPIPVDFEGFYEPPKARKAGDRSVIFLGVGSLSPTRKYDDIIRGAAELKKRGYDSRVILVCKDVWKNTHHRDFLENLVRETGMEGRVEFRYHGATDDELRELRRRADFFVFPNHITIWSMASFEAMASGLPLLVSRVTSVAEALRDGEDALFFEPGNVEELARQAERLLRDPGRYAKIAAAGQRFVKKNLNWDLYARRLVERIQELP